MAAAGHNLQQSQVAPSANPPAARASPCQCCSTPTRSICGIRWTSKIKASPEFQRQIEDGVKALREKADRISLRGSQRAAITVVPLVRQLNVPPNVPQTELKERLEAAVKTLQQPTFFTFSTGSYPSAVQWTSTTIGTFLIDYLALTNDPRYFDQFVAFYHNQPVWSLICQQYDDQFWVVLTYLRAATYATTRNKKWVKPFLCRARLFYALARRGWDNKHCGGGMYWGPRSTYKNAVTTELFITASLGMYEIYREKHLLEAAIRGWVWFKGSGMINQQGLVNDGLDDNCKNNGQTTWTYNQAIVLSGLSKLYKYTGDSELLTAAQSLIDSVISSSLVPDNSGVLVETCDPSLTCNQDQWLFKGVYFEHLGYFLQDIGELGSLDLVSRRALVEKYNPFIQANASAVWNTARGPDGRFGNWWAGAPQVQRQVSVETQGSGVAAITCALRIAGLVDRLSEASGVGPGSGEQIALHG